MQGSDETGFRAEFIPPDTSTPVGPLVLGFFALFIVSQGLIYLLKPSMTGRSVEVGEKKIRRIGAIILCVGGVMLYVSFGWWMSETAHVIDRSRVRP